MSISRAELGLDPLDNQGGPEADSGELLESLRRQAEASGATVESAPVERMLRDIRPGSLTPTVLVHENGHLHVLLGAFSVDGRLLCQVLHGDMPVSLVSKEQMAAAGFREAWRLSGTSKGVPIRVGSGCVEINELLHNFGEVLPGHMSECSFTLANRGEKSIIIAKPTASCRCALPSLEESKELAPGERIDLRVKVQSTNDASQRNSVWLKFFEKGTGIARQVVLQLVASANPCR